MMSTVDGRLYVNRYSLPFDGVSNEEYHGYYFENSDQPVGDAIMMGRTTTVQESFMPNLFDRKNYLPTTKPETFIAKPIGTETVYIVVDAKGKTFYEDHEDIHYVAILSEQVSDEYLAHLQEKKVSYVFAGPEGKDLDKAMATFLKSHDLSGKIVIPFATHGGDGHERSFPHVQKATPKSKHRDGIGLVDTDVSGSAQQIESWLKKIEVIK